MNLRYSVNGSNLGALLLEPVSAGEREVLNEETFRRMISIERKRTERSRKPFLLMLLDTGNRQESEKKWKSPRPDRVRPAGIHQRNRRNRLVQEPGYCWRAVYRARDR